MSPAAPGKTVADLAPAWWSAPDVDELAQELAARPSRLWQVADPAQLADWVFTEPQPAPLTPGPATLPESWEHGLDESQRAAYALTGWVIRMAVPEAARTAGSHWLVSDRIEKSRPLLRLTVGLLETFGVHQSGDGVWLRVALAPIVLAAEAGAIDLDRWQERGVDGFDDTTKTLAEDKIALSCPDIETARWLLRQPSVLTAARLLNVMLAVDGRFPYKSRYQSQVAARAWLAAESLLGSEVAAGSATVDNERGFDRPYAAPAVPTHLPAQRSFDSAAYRTGVEDHDRLCSRLIADLMRRGIQVGAGLHGVPVDLAWRDEGGKHFVAEVKSVSGTNDVEQLRLGLGQVLEYRHRLAALGVSVTALLLVPRCDDPAWRDICADNGVTLLVGDGYSGS